MKYFWLLTFIVFTHLIALTQAPAIHYTLGMSHPWTHLFEVEMACVNMPGDEQQAELRLPVWRTGRYLVMDFAGGVEQFSAFDGQSRPLRSTKSDKSTWRVETHGATTIIVRYTVYANEFNLRTRGLNDDHGFVDGTSVFLYIEKYRSRPVTLTVVPYGSWHVTTGLDSVAGARFTYQSPSYDDLVDCPIEIGNQNDYTLEIEGKAHIISLSGTANCAFDSVGRDVSRIVRMNKEFWGDLPYKRFVFLIHGTPEGSGATEHMNSVVIDYRTSPTRYPEPCHGLLGYLSHEFFHTWNVKRLRPKGMDPYDWTRENYYKELWLAEGATSYLHGLLLMRNGYSTATQYLNGIDSAVQYDRQRPGNGVQSLTESSFDAWIKFSRNTREAYNFETDLYSKGANVSMLMDLEIRHRSENKHSFDDLIRTLYRRFPRGSGGYTVDDVERAASELAGSSMRLFFESYVYGEKPLDWERALDYAGLELIRVDSLKRPWLGIATSDESGRTIVRTVVAGSPAYDAGVNVNDEIVALDGYRTRTVDLQKRIQGMHNGDQVRLVALRDDRLREFTVTLRNQDVPPYGMHRAPAPSSLQKSIYESWLHQAWQ